MNQYPKVVILTINYNQYEMTIECIYSILKLKYPNYKIYIIDNDSQKNNYSMLKKEFDDSINILKTGRNLGYAKGINFGLEATVSEKPAYWLIMNNDTKLQKNIVIMPLFQVKFYIMTIQRKFSMLEEFLKIMI